MLQAIEGENIQGILGVMVPIVAIVGGLSLAAASMYLKSRERMEMISRGMDITALEKAAAEARGYRRRRSPLSRGLSVLGMGVGLLLAYYVCNSGWVADNDESHTVIYIAFVALFVGLGMVISHLAENKAPAEPVNRPQE